MRRAELVFPSLILAMIAAFLAYGAVNYTWTALAFPLGAGLILCGLCFGELAKVLTARGRRQPAAEIDAIEETEPAPLSSASIAWIFALAVFLYGLGFVAGPACYLLVYLLANRFSWPVVAGIATASVVVTWGVFIKIIGILLPVAPLWMG
jgi:hypothetical protein